MRKMSSFITFSRSSSFHSSIHLFPLLTRFASKSSSVEGLLVTVPDCFGSSVCCAVISFNGVNREVMVNRVMKTADLFICVNGKESKEGFAEQEKPTYKL